MRRGRRKRKKLVDIKKELEEALKDVVWNFKGILDTENKLHPIPKNIQIQALFEYLGKERIEPLAKKWGSTLTESLNTRAYPDMSIEGGAISPKCIAVDIKTTRRLDSRNVSGFTLGSYGGYFKYPDQKRPGCTYPYGKYSEHWIAGYIYTWNEEANTLHMVSDLELIVHEKWKLASKSTGTGTTTAIGSIKRIDRLREGKGDFNSEQEFLDYWRSKR